METKELFIQEDTIVLTQDAKISFNNYPEIEEKMQNYVKKYSNLAVTIDTIKDDKKIRAQLNKDKSGIKNLLKAVKTQVLEPYALVETQGQTLIGIIDEVCLSLDSSIKDLELQQKEEKKTKIEEIIDAELKALLVEYQENDYVLEFVGKQEIEFDKTWLNTSTTTKKIKEAIALQITQIELRAQAILNDLEMIGIEVHGARIKALWERNGHNLIDAKIQVLADIKREEQVQREIDEKREDLGIDIENIPVETVVIKDEPVEIPKAPKVIVEEDITVEFRLIGPQSKVKQVINLMKELNLTIIDLNE